MGCLSGCLARPKDPQSSEPVPSPNFLRSLFGRSNSAGGRHQNPRRRLETRRRGDICRASGSRSPERFRIVMALEAFLRSAVFLMIDYRNESGVQKAWTATGIIRYRAGQAFLVTALHNLTGREPDGRCKDTNGCLPNFIKIEGVQTHFEKSLYEGQNRPSNDRPLYWKHPKGGVIDVGVLQLGFCGIPGSLVDESFFDEHENALEKRLHPTQDCFIVGFPENLVDRTDPSFPRPIFKTAHIAFDPRVDFQGEPIVLLDAVTRPGQSGSPVFATGISYRGTPVANCLVGIYTGRHVSFSPSREELEHLSIGRVFKPKVINEIFHAAGL